MRGNVVDLAVAVIIGVAFGKIISSLVEGIIMPLLGLLLGGINITSKTFIVGDAVIKWGAFLQTIIDFTIIAFAIFMAMKLVNLLKRQNGNEETEKLTHEEALLAEIRDLLKENLKSNRT